ncbi:MAG: RNA methyltransferase [Paramuribaculum sp.]|nr:RNA methyltransferase [Paramuribaculum sp.]
MQKKTIWDLDRPDIEHYREQAKMPVTVVLDNIRSLNNIGSIFRTCDAFAVEHLALCGITATPPSVEIHKTALGAEDSVEWSYHADTLECVSELRRRGYLICALEQAFGSIELQDFPVEPGKRYAIIPGHEVNGVSQQVVDAADFCLEIPQRGTKHSLNVSVSTGVALWHFFSNLLPG